MSHQIEIKRKFKYPVHQVWGALSSKEALSDWLMETSDFALSEGHQFQFRTKPRGGFDGVVHCEMLEFKEPESMKFTWKASNWPQPTTVVWSLSSIGDSETLLTLSHNGFVGINGWFTKKMLGFGWKNLLGKKLENYLSA